MQARSKVLKMCAIMASTALVFLSTPQPAQASGFWTGNGGRGIRLAVLEPEGKGLSADEQWKLSLIQSSITGDFNKFSAMTIIDRQNLERIFAEWKESMSGAYSDSGRIRIGQLANASHILTGTITKTPNAFMLEFAVTDVASGQRKASFSPRPVSPLALENLSAVKEASADLLGLLGVTLTTTGLEELKRVPNTARIQAEAALARGIFAQRQGTEVAALSYFFQAAAFDSSLFEAASRSSIMFTNISSGNIGADIRNDIVWRRSWVARLTETEEIFHTLINDADPPYTLFYSTRIEIRNIDYQTETASLSIPINLSPNETWFNAMNKSLQAAQAVLDGLNATNRKNDWGLANWPGQGLSNTNPFASVKQYDIAVAFELVNEQGRVIGSQTIRLNPFFSISLNNNGRFTASSHIAIGTVTFNAARADDISDNLTIRVASVNGTPPQNARFTISAVTISSGVDMTDSRDGQRYRTLRVGNTTWMAQNLNFATSSGSWCYDNNASNCNTYGRLYNWSTAMTACPAGWRLPTKQEWDHLGAIVGSNAKTKLKSRSGWIGTNSNVNGTDDFGFSALPGGYREGSFKNIGSFGYWWSTTESGSNVSAYRSGMGRTGVHVLEGLSRKTNGFSVRCIRD